MAATSNQLKDERTRLQSELEQIKERRIEATLVGSAFNESDQISKLVERISVLDEAIIVAEEREEKQLKQEQREAEKRRRQERKDLANSIAERGTKQIKRAESAARALAKELSALTEIFEERRIEQRKIHGSNFEINLDNDEIAVSELIERLLGTIYDPRTTDRRKYGRFIWHVVGEQNWSDVFEPMFNKWAKGVASSIDRETAQDGDDEDE